MAVIKLRAKFVCLAVLGMLSVGETEALAQRPAPSRLTGIRPEAMGGAFTAVADDQNALYYNPAGLAVIPGWSMELVQINASTGMGTIKNVQKAVKVLSGGLGSDLSGKIDKIFGLISDLDGTNNNVGVYLNPNLVIPAIRFGFAEYSGFDLNITLKPLVPSLATVGFEVNSDTRVGYAHQFFNKRLSIGAAAAFRVRAAFNDELNMEYLDAALGGQDKLMTKLKQQVGVGQGIGVDLGTLVTLEEKYSTIFGLAVQNVGDLSFSKLTLMKGFDTSVPDPIPQSVNVGLSMTPRWKTLFVRASVDYKDLNIAGPASRKLGLGVETGWSNHIRLQAGMSNGAPTAGFEMRLWILNLRAATYVAERTNIPGQQRDRRFVVGVKALL